MTGWPCGGPRRDRRTADAEPLAVEVDGVHLLRIQEAVGGGIPDLGVVLPAVPEPPHDVDDVLRLGEQRRDRLVHTRVAEVVERGNVAASEMARLVPATRDLRLPAGAAEARVVERRDRLRDVERLGVGRRDRGDQPDAARDRRDARCDQQGVEAAAHLIGALVRPERKAGLQGERVLDRGEVDAPGVGPLHDVDPVLRGEEVVRARGLLAPRGGMPAGALECDAETQSVSGGHQCSCSSKSVARRFRASDVSIAAP